jgi:hypothetical protein
MDEAELINDSGIRLEYHKDEPVYQSARNVDSPTDIKLKGNFLPEYGAF